MDKKKIEIIVIVLCIVVTGGVLWYGFGGGGGSETPPPVPGSGLATTTEETPVSSGEPSAEGIPTVENGIAQPAPAVFPGDSTMDTRVYSSTKFRNLQDYTPLTVSPEEIGRPNPFAAIGQ
jgi:hypothetical protein